MTRLPIVGVIGSGTDPYLDRSQGLGRLLAKMGFHLLTGGGGGVMSSVSQAFYEMPDRQGLVIGILPCSHEDPRRTPKPCYPNPWVEIPIATHLPLSGVQGQESLSRNHINILTADAVVALPGGPGTVSEIKLALRYQRPIIAFLKGHLESSRVPESVLVTEKLARIQNFLQDYLPGDPFT